LRPELNLLRQSVYLAFDRIVRLFGGYEKYHRIFKIAGFTGGLRNYIGYVGGASKRDYLNAIAASFPGKSLAEHKSILAAYWRDHQKIFLELFMYPQMTGENIIRLVDLQGRENLERAVSGGMGAILPVPHLGNVRLLHYALALYGYHISVVSSGYIEDPEIVRRFKLKETSKAHEVGFRGENPKWIIEALKDNRLIQIASTAEAGSSGVEVNFLGRRLFLSSGWVRLAITSGAPILPTYIVRGKDERHTIFVEPEFHLIKGKNRAETARLTAQALLVRLESIYRAHPHLIDWMSWQNRLREAEAHYSN